MPSGVCKQLCLQKNYLLFLSCNQGCFQAHSELAANLSEAAKHVGPSSPQWSYTLQSQSDCCFAQIRDRRRMGIKMAASLQSFPAAITTCLLPPCCQETQKAHLLWSYPKPDCPEQGWPAGIGITQLLPSQPAHPLPTQGMVDSVQQLEPHVSYLPKNT